MSDTSAANGNGHALGPNVTHRWLQDLLYDKRVTQRALADAWGINEAMVSRLIRRGAGNITLDRIDALADLVRVPAEELLQRFRDGGSSVSVNGNDGEQEVAPYADKAEAIAQLIEAIEAVRALGVTVHVQIEV